MSNLTEYPQHDILIYNKRMSLPMVDKLDYIIDDLIEIPDALIVDFGCADGSMLREIDKLVEYENYIYISVMTYQKT